MTRTDFGYEFAYIAVVDAYKWWINSDFGFLQATGVLAADGSETGVAVGTFDVTTMRRIARAYTVNRNIPAHAADAEGQRLAQALQAADVETWLCKPFAERAKCLADFVRSNPVQLEADANGKVTERQLASALSKLTWFLRPRDWTIFDKFVGAAVLGRDQAGIAQMTAYYETLAPTWGKVSTQLVDEVDKAGLCPLLGYRVADKYLFAQGVGMYRSALRKNGEAYDKVDSSLTLAQRFQSGAVQTLLTASRATGQVLSLHMGDTLSSLAAAVSPILSASAWIKDPA
ncbi:hypothetical protein [Novosphingobium sp. HII-3]|uniref:hypothetical protein n=1 Tax=Novosphingobium sp. HII-3 TaxID=2075565 RepID=UPI000CDAA067|nr:hypothetical protein [Novosphingobium sp. HII-3]